MIEIAKKILDTVLSLAPTPAPIKPVVGIGIVFGALILGVSRNPTLKSQLFSYAVLGFAFSEATGKRLFALMVGVIRTSNIIRSICWVVAISIIIKVLLYVFGLCIGRSDGLWDIIFNASSLMYLISSILTIIVLAIFVRKYIGPRARKYSLLIFLLVNSLIQFLLFGIQIEYTSIGVLLNFCAELIQWDWDRGSLFNSLLLSVSSLGLS